MTAIALEAPQRAIGRTPARGSTAAFLAALAMHAALVGSLWIAMQWRTSASAPAVAELWELPPLPEAEAPPAPVRTAAPPPPAEAPTPPAPEIVQRQEAPHRQDTAPRKNTPVKDKKAKPAPGPSAEDVIQQEVQREERHHDEMARLANQANTNARQPSVSSPGPMSNAYSARIQAAVRAHLAFSVPESAGTRDHAVFDVFLLPNGEQSSEPRLVQASGVPGYDDAARRAIMRTDPFPLPESGTIPSRLRLEMYPQDSR